MAGLTDFEKMERDGWANPSIAKGYADGFDHATRQVGEELADAVHAASGTKALDLCCGHGVVCAALASRGAAVTGLDFSPAMVELAKAAVPDASIIEGDATETGLQSGHFDAVTIGFGVPHFPDPAAGLAEAARVLRKGGRLAFSIWHGRGSNGAFGWLFDAVARSGDPGVTLPDGPDAHAFTDPDIAIPALKDAGFANVSLVDVASEAALAAPTMLFDAFDQGAVRAASLLGGQPEHLRTAIRTDLAERLLNEGRRIGDMWHAPMPSVIVSATRQ